MLSVDQQSHTTATTTPSSSLSPSPDPPSAHPPPPPQLDLPTPPPNFSIRDYVLASRSKDINNNWPFSSKSLRLCLKHGLKEVLPPFHTLEKLKDQSFETPTVGTNSTEKHSSIHFEKEASRPVIGDDLVTSDLSNHAPLHKKLAESCLDASSCRAGEENDFPSTITSVHQSELESIVPDNRRSRSVPSKHGTLVKASCEVEAASDPSPPQNTESTSKPIGRKCRLVVKLGVQSGRSLTEDISSNFALKTATETMASKVCPVCKTFSSSSNTTLNAHIDQCLSTESTSLWTPGSKVTRHRIKPRRVRLMVDIYTNAQECTLEDLDLRNGTNWSTIASLPTRETEKTGASVKRKKQSILPAHQESDSGDVGPVYIDANGTKVRILSKLHSPTPPASVAGNDIGGKGSFSESKCISTKKKRRVMQKHQKYLKLAPQSKKHFSDKVQDPQMGAGQKVRIIEQMDGEDAQQVAKTVQAADSGTFKPWLCSKQRGFAKKTRSRMSGQTTRCKWHLPHDLLVDCDQSFPGGCKENRGPDIANFPGDAMPSPEFYQRKDRRFHNVQASQEECLGRKRVGSSLVATKAGENVERLLQFSKARILIKGGQMLLPPVSDGNNKSSPRKKLVDIRKKPFCVAEKTTGSSRAIVTKARRFSSFRKNILSDGNRCPNTISEHSKRKKAPALKKSLLHEVAWKGDQMARYSGIDQESSFSQDLCNNESEREDGGAGPSLRRADVPENDEEKGLLSTTRNSVDCYGSYKGANVSVNNYECGIDCTESDSVRVQPCGEDLLIGPSSMALDGRREVNFAAPEVYVPGPCIEVQSSSFPLVENHRGLSSDDGQRMFCVDGTASDLVGHNSDLPVTAEYERWRENCFTEVEPISIPGPPGSYLPSPRDLSSEDFQGNSSLTTSRVQSSVDMPEVVDGESSDSPISIASTLSNSDGGKCGLKYFEAMAGARSIASQDRIRTGPVPQITSPVLDKPSYVGEYSMLNSISIEKGSLSCQNDMPCCCQRKEISSRDVCLNHEESQLLRRRKLSSLTFSATEKQVRHDAIASHPKLGGRPEFVSRSTSESDNLVRPMPAGSNLSNDSPNIGARLLARADCDSASPASNPVLRLMGKNLMVINKDEESSVAHEPVHPTLRPTNRSISQNMHQSRQLPSRATVSAAYNPYQNARGFHHIVSGDSIAFNEGLQVVGHYYDVGLSASSRMQSDHRSPREVALSPAVVCREQRKDYFDIPPPDQRSKYAGACNHPVKEIIVIDDSSEGDTAGFHGGVKYTGGWRDTPQTSSATPLATTPSYNPRVYPVSCFQPPQQHHCPLRGEAAAVQHASVPGMVADANAVRWGCIPEPPGSEPKNAASSSAHGQRSQTFHYYPSFS